MRRKEFAILVIAMMAASFVGGAAINYLTIATLAHGQEPYGTPPSPYPAQSRTPYAQAGPLAINASQPQVPQGMATSPYSQVVTARGLQFVDERGKVRLSLELAPESLPGAPGAWGQAEPQLLLRDERGEVLWSAPQQAGIHLAH
jgi:hypothetical protein